MSRSRSWCYTLNNPTEAEALLMERLAEAATYHVVGKEVGESGTEHAQGFVHFKNAISLQGVKKYLARAHWESKVRTSTFAQASEYCKKDGQWCESGTLPMDQADKGKSEQDRWRDIIRLAEAGDWESLKDEYPVEYGMRLRSLQHIHSRRPMDVQTLAPVTKQLWFFGPPGTGKSRRARFEYPEAFIKDPKERWWDGYDGQKAVIIDDFDVFQKAQGGDMKRWLDIYPFQAPFKGGYQLIRPEVIVVTSNYHPREIWDDELTVKCILRRVELHRFVFPWVPPATTEEEEDEARDMTDAGVGFEASPYASSFNPPGLEREARLRLMPPGGCGGAAGAPPATQEDDFEISSNLSDFDVTDVETSRLSFEAGAEWIEPEVIRQGYS